MQNQTNPCYQASTHPASAFGFLTFGCKGVVENNANCQKKDFLPGKYYHFGLAAGAKRSLASLDYSIAPKRIGIVVNIDGLPLTKSTSNQFWPISGKIAEPLEGIPFTIGLYHGAKDPEMNLLLRDFVDETQDLKHNGFEFHGTTVTVKILGYVCDAPARAKITYTVTHNAHCGCSKCFTIGQYFKPQGASGGRVTFPELNAPLRTDENFRQRVQPQYHKNERSVLE